MHLHVPELSSPVSPLLLQQTSLVRQSALQEESLKSPVQSFQGKHKVHCSLLPLRPQVPVPYVFRSPRYIQDTRICLLHHILQRMHRQVLFFCLLTDFPENSHGLPQLYRFSFLEYCS